MEIDQLWAQFKSEARSSYGLYSRDVRHEDYLAMSPVKRALHLGRDFFWAVMMKLTPSRRILLLAGLLFVVLGWVQMNTGYDRYSGESGLFGSVFLLLVLVLEVSDRIIMKRDLEIAREIQRWLVPDKPPQIPGLDIAFITRPANTVAGDYYDVLPIGDPQGERVLLAVADVAGKSMPAALLMATFQASLHTLSGSCDTLVPLIEGVNRYACKHSRSGTRFTTALLAILDLKTGELTYSNAGHNAPMLRRADGAIERLDRGGVPLGILPDAHYDCGTVHVAAGDALIVFTDGVVEANNDAEQEFGEANLLTIVERAGGLRAQDFIQTLTIELDRFVGQARQHDDITCLAVRVI